MALPYSSRNGRTVRLIAIHTAEGSRTKESLFQYFNSTQAASSHVGIDAAGISPDWVNPVYMSWTLLNGNPISVNAELCAFARWSRATWLSNQTTDGCANPREIIRNAAKWAARMCREFRIPAVKLSPADVAAGKSGICGHVDWTIGMRDGDHTDPGSNFPWDVFIADVKIALGEDDMPNHMNDIGQVNYKGTPVTAQAVSNAIEKGLEDLRAEVRNLRDGVNYKGQDVANENIVQATEGRVAELQADVSDVQSAVTEVKSEQAAQRELLEAILAKLNDNNETPEA